MIWLGDQAHPTGRDPGEDPEPAGLTSGSTTMGTPQNPLGGTGKAEREEGCLV